MKQSKNQMRRARRKALKQEAAAAPSDDAQQTESKTESKAPSTDPIIDDTPEDLDTVMVDDPLWKMYQGIVSRFEHTAAENGSTNEDDKPQVFFNDADDIPDEDDEAEAVPKMSKKKRKEMTQLSVAELKAVAPKPDVVEWTDQSASDPQLLIHIKAHRNVIPVPQHWSLKREYLSSKRGIEKAHYVLPKFIQDTGIAEMRDAALKKEEAATLKQKQRERVQPKMGKMDIDYQKLYEAFFRFQTKPELTRYGEVYYEGKEYETNLKHLRPGEMSAELLDALGMSGPSAPPPWLISQQRWGVPPSYPALRIPGINAPLPEGASWGYAPGAFGKPPVDDHNRPLYGGDLFGLKSDRSLQPPGESVERNLWGELQPEEESEDESEEEEEEEDDEDEEQENEVKEERGDRFGLELPAEAVRAEDISGDYNISGKSAQKASIFGNREIKLEDSQGRTAHQIIPERQSSVQGFFGGDHVYDLSSAATKNLPVLGTEDEGRKRKKPGDVDVSVDLDSNDLSKGNLQSMYDNQRQQENNPEWGGFQEDLSDMIAQESRKRARKADERRGKR